MTPSKYQQGIYDWIQSGKGGGIVRAVAGSGKTTTLVNSSELISGTALMCAFNKHIENELTLRLKGSVVSKTIHSIGMGALYRHVGKLNVEQDKYLDICSDLALPISRKARFDAASGDDAIKTPGKAKRTLHSLARMAMMTLTDTASHDELKAMASLYSIRIPTSQADDFFDAVPKVIDAGERLTRDGTISFEDMIYYPAAKNLPCKEHLWVMVDEAQDLSAAQLSIVMNSLKSRGRLIAVGDEIQSLYGFTGADPWSFSNIKKVTDTELPLSICYRCSESIVDLASKIVPEIEPRDNAPEGSVEHINRDEMYDIIENGDMVLCRTNSPLVEVVIDLITDGRKAFLRGRDIMQSFLDIVDMATNQVGYSWKSFLLHLYTLRDEMQMRLIEDGEEGAACTLTDFYNAVGQCYIKMKCGNVEELKGNIKDLFRETPGSIVCSSIHRAKGLESDNVFIVHPHRIRLKWKDQQDWQLFQEQCCEYVAITRAKENLYIVNEDGEKGYRIGERIELPEKKDTKDEGKE